MGVIHFHATSERSLLDLGNSINACHRNLNPHNQNLRSPFRGFLGLFLETVKIDVAIAIATTAELAISHGSEATQISIDHNWAPDSRVSRYASRNVMSSKAKNISGKITQVSDAPEIAFHFLIAFL